jgi:small-conductance mechanosensitive channel
MIEKIEKFVDQLREILEIHLFEINEYAISLYNIFLIVFIIILARIVMGALRRFVKREVKGKSWVTEGKQMAIIQIGKYILYFIAFILILRSINIDITPLIIGSSALFVGLGFGLQEAFRDFISGLILLFEGDVMIGDVIEMENHIVAVVKQINLRTSKVRTRDGIMLIVPNSQLTNDRVINWSNSSKLTRFNITVGVAYGSDTELVQNTLLDCAARCPEVSDKLRPTMQFIEFGESSLNFKLLFWSEEVWRIEVVKSKLRFDIDQSFRKNGVTIPFPQRDLHFKSKNISLND